MMGGAEDEHSAGSHRGAAQTARVIQITGDDIGPLASQPRSRRRRRGAGQRPDAVPTPDQAPGQRATEPPVAPATSTSILPPRGRHTISLTYTIPL